MATGELNFESGSTLFAELNLPVPIQKLFPYRVPAAYNEKVKIGQRAIVQFGHKKILTGIVAAIHTQPPKEYEAKYILDLLDESEVVTAYQFMLYQWMADYYMCTVREVFSAPLPSGLKLSSESMVQLNPSFFPDDSSFDFSEKERVLIHHLQSDTLSYSDIANFLGAKTI